MSIRDKLNNSPAAATIGAIVLLVLCLGLVIYMFGGGAATDVERTYYLDTNTGEIFTSEDSQKPTEAPSGPNDEGAPAGYRANIYGCNSCGDLQNKTLEEIQQMDNVRVEYLSWDRDNVQGIHTAEPALQPDWVPPGPSAQKVTQVELQCDSPRDVVPCVPNMN